MTPLTPGLHQPLEPLDGLDPLSMRVLEAFMRAVAAHRQLMFTVFAQEAAHPAQAFCLKILGERDGMSQRELAAALHLAPPTVTAMLQRMERAGTIERRPDRADGRVTRVHLTPAGRERGQELRGVLGRAVGATLDPLPEGDRRELERLLLVIAERAAQVACSESAATNARAADAGATNAGAADASAADASAADAAAGETALAVGAAR